MAEGKHRETKTPTRHPKPATPPQPSIANLNTPPKAEKKLEKRATPVDEFGVRPSGGEGNFPFLEEGTAGSA